VTEAEETALMPSPADNAAESARSGAGARAALRFIVLGDRGDGKSALVGRLLDGRERGAACGLGERRFATPRREFVLVDPAEESRVLVSAAGHADLALLLVDARKGLSGEDRRHAVIASVMGICRVVLAVDKMDLAGFGRAGFDAICESFRTFAAKLGFTHIAELPLCAGDGGNIFGRSARMAWYAGPTLLELLETVDAGEDRTGKPFRLPVQASANGTITGTLASGSVRAGDTVTILPAGRTTTVRSLSGDGTFTGDTITVTLGDAATTGDMLTAFRDRPQVADQFAGHLIWLADAPLLPERVYLMAVNGCTLAATVTNLRHRIDTDTLAKLAAKTLARDEIGVCHLSTVRPIVFDSFADNRATGTFILLDRDGEQTVAIGTIDFALRRATNVHYQNITVSKAERSALMKQKPVVLWFTGLPGAGKSTIANLVEAGLHARGVHTLLLDGDNIRHGLNRDLGFTEEDRVENIRRIGEVAKLMSDAGLIVLCSFISPFRAERRMVRELLPEGEFVEIFVDTPLEECIARDPKGLYKRALAGEIKNFTGVDQPYEPPENADIRLDAGRNDAERLANEVIGQLVRRKIV
jgi:bifunctional enzyme CysN/CysC